MWYVIPVAVGLVASCHNLFAVLCTVRMPQHDTTPLPQHGGALTVAGVVVGNWKSRRQDSFVKVVNHVTARSAPPTPLSPMIASISYVIYFIHVLHFVLQFIGLCLLFLTACDAWCPEKFSLTIN